MTRAAIAVVDDEAAVRKGLSRLLRSADFDPQTYASAEEFFAAWKSAPPDCLVMDLQMPDVSGFEVQAALNRLGADLPVVIVTAHDEPEIQRKCMKLGAAAFLCKPLDGEVLLAVIEKALERNKPQQ